MATAFPRTTLAPLVATVLGLPPVNVVWIEDAEPFIGPVHGDVIGLAKLSVSSRRTIGVDEEARTYPDGMTTTVTTKGQREVGVTVRLEGYDANKANDLLELLISALGIDANRATLRAGGIAYTKASAVVTFDEAIDTRTISVATVDVFFNMSVSIVQTTGGQAGYIEFVTMTGTGDLAPAGTTTVGS